jgi:hypothetical protein
MNYIIKKLKILLVVVIFLVSCVSKKYNIYEDLKPPTKIELMEKSDPISLKNISETALEHVKVKGILAGEDVASIMFELDVIYSKKNDVELVVEANNLPNENVGALYYFTTDLKAVKKSHPVFFKLMEKNRNDEWPAVVATVRDSEQLQ